MDKTISEAEEEFRSGLNKIIDDLFVKIDERYTELIQEATESKEELIALQEKHNKLKAIVSKLTEEM